MRVRLTDELLNEIIDSKQPKRFLDSMVSVERDLGAYLTAKLEEKNLKRSQVVRAANLNETFGYQIFMGQRKCSRDKALALGFAMGFDLHEMRMLLCHADCADLYSKNRRDAIIIFAISHGLSLQETDAELYRFGEKTICGNA